MPALGTAPALQRTARKSYALRCVRGTLNLVRIHERQRRPALAFADRAVEARAPPGVAGRARLLDLDPDRVLVAVHSHLDHALGVAGGLALAPQRIARAAEIPGVAALDGLAQRLGVHVRDHQHLAARSIGGDAGQKTSRVEFGLECQPLLAVVRLGRWGHRQPRKLHARVSAAALAPWTGNAPAPPDCRGTCR